LTVLSFELNLSPPDRGHDLTQLHAGSEQPLVCVVSGGSRGAVWGNCIPQTSVVPIEVETEIQNTLE